MLAVLSWFQVQTDWQNELKNAYSIGVNEAGHSIYEERSVLACSGNHEISNNGDLRAHSHITSTLQPRLIICLTCLSSLSVFCLNFSSQLSRFCSGIVANLHPLCLCQKHPCTKIAKWYLAKTISGLPGNFLSWSRYRNPRECKKHRTNNSGLVSLPLIPAIMRDRVWASTISVIPGNLGTIFQLSI